MDAEDQSKKLLAKLGKWLLRLLTAPVGCLTLGIAVLAAVVVGIIAAVTSAVGASTGNSNATAGMNTAAQYNEQLEAAAKANGIPSFAPVLRGIAAIAGGDGGTDVMRTLWFMEIEEPEAYTPEQSIQNGTAHFAELLQEAGISEEYDDGMLPELLPVFRTYRNGTEEENSAFAAQMEAYLQDRIGKLSYPIENHAVSSPFGNRDLTIGGSNLNNHLGTDFAAPTGTPIYASTAGNVIFSGYLDSTYGYAVKIRWSSHVVTLYAHCSAVAVREGQTVRRGDQIAYVGMSGVATGPHCHLGLYLDGVPVDPMEYLLGEKVLPNDENTGLDEGAAAPLPA